MIKIEVTGNSIAEVADKLLAIGGSLKGAGAPTHKLRADPAPQIEETVFVPDVVVSKAPAAPLDPAGPAAPEPAAGTSEATSSATTATASPSKPVISAEAVKTLVLSVVREKGREAMIAVLDTFGVAKATDVPADQLHELVAALEALL